MNDNSDYFSDQYYRFAGTSHCVYGRRKLRMFREERERERENHRRVNLFLSFLLILRRRFLILFFQKNDIVGL